MKKVVIMGATSGIGLNVAERLASDGMRVAIAGRKVEVMRELQQKYPGRIVYSRIDVTQDDAPERLRDLIRRLGGMDVYFHVAGIGYGNDELEIDKEVATMQTNVVGFTRMVDVAFRYFRDERAGFGQIAAITSVAGTNGIGHLAAYSASKKFQQTYLRALRRRARVAVVDWRWNLLVGLWRLVPNALWVRLPIPVETIASPARTALNSAEAADGELS